MVEQLKVYGPPGTGKSTYIAHRVKLFREMGYKRDEILVITYRKDTAVKLGIDIPGARVATIHSACLRLVGNSSGVMSRNDESTFTKLHGYPIQKTDDTDGGFLAAWDWVRHTGGDLSDISEYPAYDDLGIIDIIDAVTRYEDFKLENGKIDYTDMVTRVRDGGIIPGIKVLIVDEYQDNTKLIHETIKSWADSMDYVIIAGDPMQTIYSFSGCDPCFFIEWNAEELILEKSHRLKTPVWELGRAILKTHGQEVPEIETRPAALGDCISHMHYTDMLPACTGDQLHLVRCNFQGRRIASEFQEMGIPFVSGPNMGGWRLSDLNLYNGIVKLRTGDPLTKQEVKEVSGAYPNKIKDGEVSKKLNAIVRNVAPVSYSKTMNVKSKKIDTALATGGGIMSIGQLQKIRLLTIHGAKGGEADNVFLHTGITRKIEDSLDDEYGALAEDRVFYTGVTRAREHLFIVEDGDKSVFDIPYMGGSK